MSERDNRAQWGGARGRHEAWFLTMSRGSDGYWIRYTLRAPVAGPPERRVWFARFDRLEPSRTFGLSAPRSPGDLFTTGRASGELSGAGRRVAWDLRFETGGSTFRLLPSGLYWGGLAPTKPLSPNPDTRVSGTIAVDGEEESLQAVAAHQGHVYGTRHAERWAWAQCNAFTVGEGAFQAVSAQGRRGPVLTPFLTFAGVRLDGEWIRLRGLSGRRSLRLGAWPLTLSSRRFRLEGEVEASPEAMIRARYLDPDDTPRWCHNSEVASCRLVLRARAGGRWRSVAELVSEGTTHAEWAGRTPATDVTNEHVEIP